MSPASLAARSICSGVRPSRLLGSICGDLGLSLNGAAFAPGDKISAGTAVFVACSLRLRGQSQVQRVAEAEEGRLARRLAQGRVDVDGVRQVVEHRAHRQRMGEFAGELGDLPADRLDAEDA